MPGKKPDNKPDSDNVESLEAHADLLANLKAYTEAIGGDPGAVCLSPSGLQAVTDATLAKEAAIAATERERVFSILALPETAGRFGVAKALAMQPSMTAAQAREILAAAPLDEKAAVLGFPADPVAAHAAKLARTTSNGPEDAQAMVERITGLPPEAS